MKLNDVEIWNGGFCAIFMYDIDRKASVQKLLENNVITTVSFKHLELR